MDWSGLMEIHGAYERSRILHAAVELDLFTHLSALSARAGGLGVPAAAVAAAAGTDPRATELLLNALAGMGLLTKDEPDDPERPLPGGTYRSTEVAERHLVAGAEADFRAFVRFDAANWSRWGDLAEVVRRGAPATLDPMHQEDPAATRRFIEAMEAIGRARGDVAALVDRLDLSRAVHLLDVGGGSAAYTLAFLARHPHLSATLVDLPGTLAVTRAFVAAAPPAVQRRLRLVPLDYNRDPLPAPPPTSSLPDDLAARLKIPEELLPRLSEGYDVVFLSNIIHGEDAARNQALARKLHDVLRPGGRVVIKDHIMDATLSRPAVGAVFGITMLLFADHGRVYGFDEVRRWFEDAGFVNVEETPPRAPLTSSLVTARRPGGGLHDELQRAARMIGQNVSEFVRAVEDSFRPSPRGDAPRRDPPA